MTQNFLGLRRTDDPARFELPVHAAVENGRGLLFGGCAIAAGIEVLEAVTGRSCATAAAQCVAPARRDAVVVWDALAPPTDRPITHAQAVATVDGTETVRLLATLAARRSGRPDPWIEPPAAPPPSECPPAGKYEDSDGTVHDRFETRLVRARRARELDGTRGDGRWLGWMRFAELDAAAPQLAMVSDLAIGALWQGVGSFVGVRTVSSTLTVTGHDATGWLLADMRLEAVDADLAHLRTHLWSEDARLLGLSTTTLTMRAGTPSR